MIAVCNPTRRELRVGSVIRLDDGTNVYPEDIRSVAQARAILDEIAAAVAHITDQLADDLSRPNDPGWRCRAQHALVIKRRAQATLQHLLHDLRRIDRIDRTDRRRVAFINAAEEALDRDLFVEIWQRAAETEPAAFEDWGGVSA